MFAQCRTFFDSEFYSSGTIVATGNTGIIATPHVSNGGLGVFPYAFLAVGSSMATDETNDIVIDWYTNSAGTGGAIGTTTFNQLTAGSPNDLEVWPGDVTAFNAGRDLVALFPYHKITYTLAGTSKSMSFILYLSFFRFER